MTQNVLQIPTAAPLSGMALVTDVNNALAGLASLCSGGTAPTASSLGLASLAGLLWHDTQANQLKLRNQADSAWITLGSVNEISGVFVPAAAQAYSALSATTTLAMANAGQFLLCSAALTLTLPASSGLTSAWSVSIFAKGGPVSVALANSSDALNGTANGTLIIPKGYSAEIVTDAAGNYFAAVIPASLGISVLASAATTDLGTASSQVVSISGTTTISSFGSSAPAGTVYTLQFATSLTLTYNAASLILPGYANITTVANDCAQFLSLGSGNWICINYRQANGLGAVVDLVARDQIALTNLRLMLTSSVTTGVLIQGKQWELLTDEWGATSTNQTYAAGSPAYYTNQTYTQAKSATTPQSGSAAGATYMDRSWSLTAGNTVSHLGVNLSAAETVVLRIWERTAANTYSERAAVTYAHGGTGLEFAALSSPYTVPSNGNAFYVSAYVSPTTVRPYLNPVASSGTISNGTNYTGSNVTITEYASGNSWAVACKYSAALSMTLLPPAAITLSTAPAYADTYFLWKDDSGSAVIGTDLTVELSRDGGTTWTVSTLTNPLGSGGFDGTYAVIKARANLGGNPIGTSLTTRIKTLNSKAQRVAAPAIYAE